MAAAPPLIHFARLSSPANPEWRGARPGAMSIYWRGRPRSYSVGFETALEDEGVTLVLFGKNCDELPAVAAHEVQQRGSVRSRTHRFDPVLPLIRCRRRDSNPRRLYRHAVQRESEDRGEKASSLHGSVKGRP